MTMPLAHPLHSVLGVASVVLPIVLFGLFFALDRRRTKREQAEDGPGNGPVTPG